MQLSAGRVAPACERRAAAGPSSRIVPVYIPCTPSSRAVVQQHSSIQAVQRVVVCQAQAGAAPSPSAPTPKQPAAELAPVPSTANGKLISRTEVAAFIQRDDIMDQMYRWAIIEAGEGGVRNFGLPMNVEPFYFKFGNDARLWGYKVGIFKEGTRLCDLGIMFDTEEVKKHEWVGRGDDGFPVLEGKVDAVLGKHFEIWKLDANPVDEQLRSAIRAFCTGLVTALNRYYAFGSVFVDDAQ